MKLNNFKYILLALMLGLSSVFATVFDSEYEAAFSRGTVRNLVEHIQQLSQTAITDSAVTKAKKCEALKFFFATGGIHGFRQTPPTAEEIVVLTQALSITTMLHYKSPATQNISLDLVQINRQNGRSVDPTVQQHLTFAQSIVSYTLMTHSASSLLQYVNNLSAMPQQEFVTVAQNTKAVFSNIYKKPLESLLPYATDQVWKKRFIDEITLESQNAILQGLRLTVQSFRNAEDFDQDEIVAIKSIVSQLFSDNQPSSQSSLRRAPASTSAGSSSQQISLKTWSLKDGSTVRRTSNGQLSIQKGGLNIVTKLFNSHGLMLNANWSDAQITQILASISSLPGIM